MESLRSPNISRDSFETECLQLYSTVLSEQTYPGYPCSRLVLNEFAIDLPEGPWDINPGEQPNDDQKQRFINQGLLLDSTGRPLHPWLERMVTNPNVGVVTGKGFYWNWGPNYTADPIIVRHDLTEPHILLITRRDTGQLALPGGFVDNNEGALQAAIREAQEEALINIADFTSREVYIGPTADLRTTAHAWPHTFAYRFDVPTAIAHQLSTDSYEAGDDAVTAHWVSQSEATNQLFGAHKLLIQLALS